MKALINLKFPNGSHGTLLKQVDNAMYDGEEKTLGLMEKDGPYIVLADVENEEGQKILRDLVKEDLVDLTKYTGTILHPEDLFDDDDIEDTGDEKYEAGLGECLYQAFEMMNKGEIKMNNPFAFLDVTKFITYMVLQENEEKSFITRMQDLLKKACPTDAHVNDPENNYEYRYMRQIVLAACEVHKNGQLLITCGTDFISFCNNLAYKAYLFHPESDPMDDAAVKEMAMIALAAFRIDNDEED